ncbi:hypothetical protein PIB30_078643 [Stylosanthes scabra]|uniref:Uncharacterized protein n=1 Tax=Stylosanthes scabra TaxID=79078 RepID=A0ABU6YQD8_9FABA|nr:hypothetical protein [Stylosanthes scabra]
MPCPCDTDVENHAQCRPITAALPYFYPSTSPCGTFLEFRFDFVNLAKHTRREERRTLTPTSRSHRSQKRREDHSIESPSLSFSLIALAWLDASLVCGSEC